MDYPYENLGPEKFQEFCQALLIREFPDIQCLPVGQPDGGRDALSYLSSESSRNFIVFQVKFVREPKEHDDPHLWLANILKDELPKVAKLIPNGAKKYILLTNIRGTSHLESGSIDKVNRLLDNLDLESICWWRDDINRRLDNAWELKWVYQELMIGPDLIRAIIESGLSEERERRASAIKAYIQDQFDKDEDVRFKQVDLQHKLLDLFIDLPIIPPQDPGSRKKQINFEWLYRSIAYEQRHRPETTFTDPDDTFLTSFVDREGNIITMREGRYFRDETNIGAVTLLLHPKLHEFSPQIVLEGAPGQGKSTITQYLCQIHRMRLLKRNSILESLPTQHTHSPVRLPFRVDLRDYATWLSKKDPFSAEQGDAQPQHWQKSLEAFLAAQVRYHSGGIEFNQSDLAAVIRLSAILLVLDGLDEVVDITRRQEVVNEIVSGVSRLEANAASLQVIVTSRPAAFANSPGLPEKRFPYFQLGSVTRPLIEEYTDKWLKARGVYGRERSDIKNILKEKLDQPHIRELAKNPMQLTILLSLVHTRGSSLPDKRTALYDNYIDLFFNREAEKNSIVREHRDLLINIHRYLAWVLHTESEMGRNSGSITETRLHKLLVDYLANEGYDPNLASILFTGMVERVVALVSRVQGTYEFEVQPLREYFAARYLYETAPYSPVGNEKRGALPDRFNAIARDFYWLNVTRFYAGCYSKGELPSLIECLRELIEENGYNLLSHPRILASTLLSDWVFTQHPKSVKEVIKLILDGIGLRYVLASDSRRLSSGTPLVLPKACGKDELLQHCFIELRNFYPRDYALDIIDLIKSNANLNEITESWLLNFPKGKPDEQTQWIEYGLYLGLLTKLDLKIFNEVMQGPELRRVIDLVFRARRFDYCDASEENTLVAIQAILQLEAKSVRHQRTLTNLELFDQSLSPDRYAVAFSTPRPIPLSDIWKQSLWLDETLVRVTGLGDDVNLTEPRYPELHKCQELIKLAISITDRTAEEWATRLTPWDEIVEKGRSLWGEQWVFNQLANISGGIRSQTETYKDFSELLDHTKSLCKRSRYARLRAGNARWWVKQFEYTRTTIDKLLVALILTTWGSSKVLVQLIELLDRVITEFEQEDWNKLYSVVRDSIMYTQNSGDRREFIAVDSLPSQLDAKTVTLVSLRAKNAHRFYLKYLTAYSGPDRIVLDFCQQSILELVAAGQVDWKSALDTIAASYRRGSISGRYAPRIFEHRMEKIELPNEIVEMILKNPANYPGFLVSFAESRYRAIVAQSIVPVGEIASRDRWFIN